MHGYFSGVEPCRIGIKACGPAHYWARELMRMGHGVVLMPPIYTKPYVKRGKNDAVDAAAIFEAMPRPGMRFVPVKSAESQAALMLRKARGLLVKSQAMSVNALRANLAEFGIVAAKGIGRAGGLLERARQDTGLFGAARAAVKILTAVLDGLASSIGELDKKIAEAHVQNETSRLIEGIPGIGKLVASALTAAAPDPGPFRSGRGFAAGLGLTPRQNSSGGKQTLGGITKQGNRRIRQLLVLSATPLLRHLPRRNGALADWIVALLAGKPARPVTVALANKLARIVFAMMKTGEAFRNELFAKA